MRLAKAECHLRSWTPDNSSWFADSLREKQVCFDVADLNLHTTAEEVVLAGREKEVHCSQYVTKGTKEWPSQSGRGATN